MFLFTVLLALPLLAALNVRDVDGHELKPLEPAGPAGILFFVTNDCPIANSYAPEIQSICGEYGTKGVACTLVYSDLSLDAAAIRKHHEEYRYPQTIRAVRDTGHKLADATGATITPEAVLVSKSGKVL